MLMDYMWTYPNATLRFYKSDMILYIDSDAAYLVLPKARSRIGGHFFLGKLPPPPPALPSIHSTNAPILTVCKRLRNVVSSAAEAETGAAFFNSSEGIAIIRVLNILNHPQPPDGCPFKMDNAVTNGFIHSNIKQKRSKAWDMRYHWLRDKTALNLYRYYWAKGEYNEGDYFTKHHPPNHHIKMQSKCILKNHLLTEKINHTYKTFFQSTNHRDSRRGCVIAPPAYWSYFPRVPNVTSVIADVVREALKAKMILV